MQELARHYTEVTKTAGRAVRDNPRIRGHAIRAVGVAGVVGGTVGVLAGRKKPARGLAAMWGGAGLIALAHKHDQHYIRNAPEGGHYNTKVARG